MSDMIVSDPIALFKAWLAEAAKTEVSDPNAMSLATVDEAGQPSARIVLLKGLDRRGFVFYTNLDSRKGRQIRANPKAALCFHWKTLGRQVRIEGAVEPVADDEADAYYASRERGSQIGAWASRQSERLADRAELEARIAELEARFGDADIPRPEFWSGLRVLPHRMEFWREGAFRLHDRIVYTPDGESWTTQRLYP